MLPTPTKPDRATFQFSVRFLLGTVFVCACVMAATVTLNFPELPIVAGIVALAWLLRRIGGASMPSVVTWAIGAELFVCAWLLDADVSWFPNVPQLLCLFLGFALCLISGIVFTVNAAKSKPFHTTGVVGILLCVMCPLSWMFLAGPYLSNLRRAERARQAAEDKATAMRIVQEVETTRAKLGRAPADQEELEELLGHPMPHVHDLGIEVQINYRRMGEDSFYLQYELWATDDWIYDSTIPNKGWVQHFY